MVRTARVMFTATVVACAGLTWLLWQEHTRAQRLQARLDVAERRLKETVQKPAVSRAVAEATPRNEATPPDRTSPTEANPPAPPRALTEGERKFRRQLTEYQRWTTLAKKADLLAGLRLPPEKSAALKDLLIERAFVARDAREAAKGAGVDPREAEAFEAAKIDARIESVLGPTEYAHYVELTSLEVFREQLNGSPIPGCLVDAGTPLTAEQKDWLSRLMYRTFGAELTDGALTARSPDPEAARQAFKAAVLSQASGNLTPSQTEALREYFRKDDELAAQMNILIRQQSPPR